MLQKSVVHKISILTAKQRYHKTEGIRMIQEELKKGRKGASTKDSMNP